MALKEKYENYTFDDSYEKFYDEKGLFVTSYYNIGVKKSDSRLQAIRKLEKWMQRSW